MRLKEAGEDDYSEEEDEPDSEDDLDLTKIQPTSSFSTRCSAAACPELASQRCVVCKRTICITHGIPIPSSDGSAKTYYGCGLNHVISYEAAVLKERGIFFP